MEQEAREDLRNTELGKKTCLKKAYHWKTEIATQIHQNNQGETDPGLPSPSQEHLTIQRIVQGNIINVNTVNRGKYVVIAE